MEVREFEVRKVNEETRTITGLAVSYNRDINIGGMVEQYRQGVFGTPENVKLFYGHDHLNGGMPIGKVSTFRETDEGLEIDAVFSKTPKADEVYTLAKDGVLDRFSVGYEPVENEFDGDTIIRTKANLKEISIVPMPADEQAKVTQVRDNQITKEVDNMSTEIETTSEDVTELRAEVTNLKREIATLGQGGGKNDAGPQYRSAIEAYQAFLKGDDSAVKEIRAYVGGTSADFVSGEDWKGLLGGIVKKNRPLAEAFSSGPLADGAESVTYEKIASVTGDVAVQAAEGDVVAALQVTTTKETATVETLAAYSNLTFQAFQRVLTSSGQLTLDRLAASYAKVSNGKVRTAMTSATPQAGLTSYALASATADKFIATVVDAITKIDLNGEGAQADFIVVSGDVWQKMASLVDSASRPVFDVNGDGSNTIGSFNARRIVGQIVGLPIIYDSGLAALSFYVASRDAVTSWESPGAPVRMEDVNIQQLFRTFALYGYFVAAATNENGLVKQTLS
jgi:HK97 family phage prohead protease